MSVPHVSPAEVLRLSNALQQAVQHARHICDAANNKDEDVDDDDGDKDVPSLGSESVQQALRLMGLFQPHNQSNAFMDMVSGKRALAFPAALKDVMGCTFTYR
jgi:hypothetical protein